MIHLYILFNFGPGLKSIQNVISCVFFVISSSCRYTGHPSNFVGSTNIHTYSIFPLFKYKRIHFKQYPLYLYFYKRRISVTEFFPRCTSVLFSLMNGGVWLHMCTDFLCLHGWMCFLDVNVYGFLVAEFDVPKYCFHNTVAGYECTRVLIFYVTLLVFGVFGCTHVLLTVRMYT